MIPLIEGLNFANRLVGDFLNLIVNQADTEYVTSKTKEFITFIGVISLVFCQTEPGFLFTSKQDEEKLVRLVKISLFYNIYTVMNKNESR